MKTGQSLNVVATGTGKSIFWNKNMNERIRQIADEAAKYSATVFLPTGENGDDLFVEKFAELIVAECVQTLIDHTPVLFTNEVAEEDWDKGYDRAMKDCVHYIQEHFGVKE
jgi:hypothetical protein